VLSAEELDAQPIGPRTGIRCGHGRRRAVREDVEGSGHFNEPESAILRGFRVAYKSGAAVRRVFLELQRIVARNDAVDRAGKPNHPLLVFDICGLVGGSESVPGQVCRLW